MNYAVIREGFHEMTLELGLVCFTLESALGLQYHDKLGVYSKDGRN